MRDKRVLKKSNKPFEDTVSELMLFKQMNYCSNYIKNRFKQISEDEINKKAKIASACFRQAFEFYESAQKATLNTSPLLYSYCINNLIRGFAYIFCINEKILNNFQIHGFSVKKENLAQNILNSTIEIKKNGVITAIQQLLNDYIIKEQKVSFELLLSHIPEITNLFLKTTNKASAIAKRTENARNHYEMQLVDYDLDLGRFKEICESIGMGGTFNGKNKKMYCAISLKGQEIIEEKNIQRNLFYKEYLILPAKFEEGIHCLNIIFYTYLLIMSYGMIVRYNADKWEDYIDPKLSNEVQLISESVMESINIIFIEIHKLLYEYSYEEISYDDNNVKSVIDNSTERIMKNISSMIKRKNMIYGTHKDLPW